ncbi:MAG: BamA/TamA family outer membrane protein [Saprospiraceae bacterium]|nr:BamA/TamA family outer membrane protein [Saprospiraceae bacterium]
MEYNRILVLLCLLVGASALHGQMLLISGIEVEGNHKTKERIILRELDFAVGDTITQASLSTRLDRNRNNLLKTGLFTEVTLNISEWNTELQQIAIAISVAESWYIFPVPLFELADRNFNVWWTEQKRSLSRVNVGLRLQLLNLNGINDHLKIKGQLGYTPKFELTYLLPFVNRKQTVGLEFNVLRSVNKEISLLNADNKQMFFEQDDEIIFRRTRVRLGTVFRPNLYVTHRLRMVYQRNSVLESLVAEYNPDFFLEGRDRQESVGIEYEFVYDDRNRAILPTRGWYTGLELVKGGIGLFGDVNTLAISPFVRFYHPVSRKVSVALAAKVKRSLNRDKVAYYNYWGLGFLEDYLRGYELYVIGGLDYVYAKNEIRLQLVDATIDWKRKMPIRSFRVMPWQFYLSFNYDVGYVNDPFYAEGNSFTNRWLHGGGVGFNFLLYNIFVFQVELSANHLGEKGLFLHTKTSF